MRKFRKPVKVGRRAGRTSPGESKDGKVSPRLDAQVRELRGILGNPADLVVRELRAVRPDVPPVAVVYLAGMASEDNLAQFVIQPLSNALEKDVAPPTMRHLAFHISAGGIEPAEKVHDTVEGLLRGKAVVLREGAASALLVDISGWKSRQIDEPTTEPSTVGPKESFIEDLQTNLTLLRRRIVTSDLRIESLEIGKRTETRVAVVYLAEVARPSVVEEVRRRLKSIEMGSVLDSQYIREMIGDAPWSPFPTTQATERPDKVAADLTEGCVAILVDGTNTVVVAPVTLTSLMQSSADYYRRYYYATFVRYLRWAAFVIGMTAPAMYVAFVTYHHELIPTALLFTVAAGRAGVPFPPVIEAFLMEMAFEVLREAGLRMPRQFGQAVSIVGVLVIGDAAVRAGIVSPLMIVVVGITAIATFALPNIDVANAVRLLRFPMLFFAGILGAFGIVWLLGGVAALLAGMRSLGVPYLAPIAPVNTRDVRDTMLRAPWWAQRFRPWQRTQPQAVEAIPPGQKPSAPKRRERGRR